MVPAKTDPRWRSFVTKPQDYGCAHLGTRILANRLRLVVEGRGAKGITEAIDTAYEYFTQNEKMVADDIKRIFG